ncbi:MAG: hypothetical protein ACJASR_000683 [Psychroserpens sp.]|jgi:hypothetical protein
MKKAFLNNEIWMLTFGASFQRANAYLPNASETDKRHFKNMISGHIENLLRQYENSNISDDVHIKNIKSVSDYSKHFSSLFVNGKINFGIAQKMLNLYLKYQWCLGNIPEPPHFPLDRIIQQKLNQQAKLQGIIKLELLPWTQFIDESHYIRVINHARAIGSINLSTEKLTPAQLELQLFERR